MFPRICSPRLCGGPAKVPDRIMHLLTPQTLIERHIIKQCMMSNPRSLRGCAARLRGLVEHGQAEGTAGQARIASANASGRHHLRAVKHLARSSLL